jgi:hypothetical protein
VLPTTALSPSVHCKRQGPSWRVWATSPPTASPHHGLRRTSEALASLTGEKPSSGWAWLSRATRGCPHSPTLIRPSVVGYFPVFVLLLCFVLDFSIVFSLFLYMYWCLSSWDSLYIFYHLNWWPRFLASVSRIIGPASSEALFPAYFRS